jgi:hypothetical protein
MRGVPNKPVRCLRCNGMTACAADQLCHSCRMAGKPNARMRFVWTTEFDDFLVSAYRRAQTRKELTRSLTALQLRTGFTRVVILARAVYLGLSFSRRRPWTPEETALLESLAGRDSTASIARKFRRTFASVKAKVKQLRISARVPRGIRKWIWQSCWEQVPAQSDAGVGLAGYHWLMGVFQRQRS